MTQMFTDRNTGAAAISHTISPEKAFELVEIKLHLSTAGGAGNLTVTFDANAGTEYDTTLLTQDMTLITDLLWQPETPISCDMGDKIVIAWANANNRTYGLETKFE